jgi:hypothetical protein
VWILAAVLGVFVLFGLMAVAGGTFLFYKARQAGFDPELMARNPSVGVAKFLAAVNPDIELISVDEAKNRVTVKEKSTGRYMTVDLRDIQHGKLSLDMGDEGRMVIGGDVKLPPWLPEYPGSKPQASVNSESTEGEGGMFHFTTKDSGPDVFAFYEKELTGDGFSVETRATTSAGGATGGMMSFKSGGRTATVTVAAEGSSTKVTVLYGAK